MYLAGVNAQRARKALCVLFKGAVSKNPVSRAWHKVKGDWESWRSRSLADEDIVRQHGRGEHYDMAPVRRGSGCP